MDSHMQHHTTRALALAASLGLGCFEDTGPGPNGPTDATSSEGTDTSSAEEGAGSSAEEDTSSSEPGSSTSSGEDTSSSESGSSMSSGEDTTTAMDTTETGWPDGTYYGECDASLLCPPGESCLYYGAHRICAAECEGTEDCPPAPPGGAVPSCAEASPEPLAPKECILACTYPTNNCPAGMMCHAISGLWFCLFDY